MGMVLGLSSPLLAQIETERVSETTDVTPVSRAVHTTLSSFDGRYFVFSSLATNLVEGGTGDLFVKDNQAGVIARISDGSVGASGSLRALSPDGRYVTFSSADSNGVVEDTNGQTDAFLADLQLNTISLVSVHTDGTQGDSSSAPITVSSDGRFVVFSSGATNLVDDDTNGVTDLFLRDMQAETTERINVSSAGVEADALANGGSISGDGRYIVFDSEATNLAPGDVAGRDVFLRDTQLDTTIKVNHRSDGPEASNGHSQGAAISANGLYVLFGSNSSTIAPEAIPNVRYSIFKYTIATDSSVQVSKAGPNNDIWGVPVTGISNDGRYITYSSKASNLVDDDTNNLDDVFLTDTENRITTRVNVDNEGNQTLLIGGSSAASTAMAISGDGNVVIFGSLANNLLDYDQKNTREFFVRDIQNASTDLAVRYGTGGLELAEHSRYPSASENGRYVTFAGTDLGLAVGGNNTYPQIYMLDRQTGIYTLVTRAHANWFGEPAINTKINTSKSSVSNDGRYVAFTSQATNLIEGVQQGNLYLYDTQSDSMTWVISGNGSLAQFAFSGDGQYLTFSSDTNNLVPGDSNNGSDVFLYNIQTKTTTLISVDSGGIAGGSDGRSWNPSISADGNFITYSSDATNLVAGDGNSQRDIFVRDIQAGQTFLVSVNSAAEQGNGFSEGSTISESGRFVAFYSMANNLVDSDTNSVQDIFVHDRQTGVTTRASVDSGGNGVSGYVSSPTISSNGQFVAFTADSADLVDGDLNGKRDVFVRDIVNGSTLRVSENASGDDPDDNSGFYSFPIFIENGAYLIFDSSATNLVPDDNNGFGDIFRASNPFAPTEPTPDLIFGERAGSFEPEE